MIVGLPVVESVLEHHAGRIASDLPAYRNHVYRIVNLVDALAPVGPADHPVLATAAVFHDIGLWTAGSWDYIPPSIAAAEQWLREHAADGMVPLVRDMIAQHHKLSPCSPGTHPLVEAFRRADWCDVTRGLRPCGVPAERYREILCLFPALGFHRRLLGLALHHAWRQPLRPFPMLRR
jgi:hypothetical protein